MTDDIVARLRTALGPLLMREAADEIERLRAALKIIWIAYQDHDGIRKIFHEAGLRDDALNIHHSHGQK